MLDYKYTGHLKGRKVLLETPSGFAMFLVKEFAFQEEKKNIWVLFSDPEYAIQVLVALGFRKIDDRSVARDCNDGPGKDLSQLIKKFCKTGEELIVQDKDLKASIEKKLKITCICDGYTVGELMWGIKNVLHKFIYEEGCNITREYCLPVSEGLQDALRYYLVNISPTRLDKSFISKFGFLRYLDLNLETFPKELLRSFDEYVGIGETVKDGLDYAKVLASVLVPDLVKKYGFSETFSSELAMKLHQAKEHQEKRGDDLTMADIEKIMGILDYLLNVPELRDKILMDVKLMEAALFRSGLGGVRFEEPVDFNNLEFRRALLKTPSGFAIFNVREDVFSCSENIWKYFSDIIDARNIVFALGFVRVDEHYVVRDSVIGPGDELRQLILRFGKANKELVVQDTELKALIESKLDVKCWTGGEAVDELIWGLKHVLSDFIPEEKDKLTDEYFLPLSKQLLMDLETYKIKVSISKINPVFISEFGYMSYLDFLCKATSKVLHDIHDQYVLSIGVTEDVMLYAWTIAKVLFPGLKTETELSKIASSLGSMQIKYTGKAITSDDKSDILECLDRLLNIYQQKSCAEQHLDKLCLGMMTVENQSSEDQTPAVGRDRCNGKNVDRTKKDGEQLSVEADGTLSTSNSCNGENVDRIKKDGKQLPVEAVGKKDGTLSTSVKNKGRLDKKAGYMKR